MAKRVTLIKRELKTLCIFVDDLRPKKGIPLTNIEIAKLGRKLRCEKPTMIP